MNKLIKELEKKSWDQQTNHVNIDKFTELLIHEIISMGIEIQDQKIENASEEYVVGRKMGLEVLMNDIKVRIIHGKNPTI
jgi:hypothetical protein